MPKVSVVIPTYNRSKYLSKAIRSVLNQTYQDFELLIVDDGSTDNTEEAANTFNDHRIRYHRLASNSGGSFVPRTTGIDASSGSYLAMMDDDSYWIEPNKLELQVKFLDDHPDYVIVGTQELSVNGNGSTLRILNCPLADEHIRRSILSKPCFYHPCVVYRKTALDSAGTYERFKVKPYDNYSNEYLLWLKLGLVGKFANLPMYGSSLMVTNFKANTRRAFYKGYLSMIKQFKDCYPGYHYAVLKWSLLSELDTDFLRAINNFVRGRP